MTLYERPTSEFFNQATFEWLFPLFSSLSMFLFQCRLVTAMDVYFFTDFRSLFFCFLNFSTFTDNLLGTFRLFPEPSGTFRNSRPFPEPSGSSLNLHEPSKNLQALPWTLRNLQAFPWTFRNLQALPWTFRNLQALPWTFSNLQEPLGPFLNLQTLPLIFRNL